jgi:hypothetical protein
MTFFLSEIKKINLFCHLQLKFIYILFQTLNFSDRNILNISQLEKNIP